jgi:hypothetical protein
VLGKTMDINSSFSSSSNRVVVKLLVEMDTSDVHLVSMDIRFKISSYNYILVYVTNIFIFINFLHIPSLMNNM